MLLGLRMGIMASESATGGQVEVMHVSADAGERGGLLEKKASAAGEMSLAGVGQGTCLLEGRGQVCCWCPCQRRRQLVSRGNGDGE